MDASDLRVGTTGSGHLGPLSTRGHALTLGRSRCCRTDVVTGRPSSDSTPARSTAIDGSLPQLVALGSALPESWRPEGSARLGGRLAGPLTNPTVDVTVASDDLRAAGQAFQSVRSTLQLADRIVTVRTLEVSQGEGRLTARGLYTIDGRRYTFTASGTGLTIDAPAATRRHRRPPGRDGRLLPPVRALRSAAAGAGATVGRKPRARSTSVAWIGGRTPSAAPAPT